MMNEEKETKRREIKMELLEAIKTRRRIRAFKPDPVSKKS